MLRVFLTALLAGGFAAPGAAILELRPVADTTLHQIAPSANMGGHTHVSIGSTAKNTPARGLFRFDLNALPAGAVVNSVSVRFNLPSLNRPDLSGSSYSVHRMLESWGEGTKVGNLGAPATAGEATWLHSAFPATWAVPGGDFEPVPSAAQVLGPAPGVYTLNSTAGLAADVREWLANPAQNFGWLLKAEDESETQTAKQFSSRETANGPLLTVEYSLAAAELRITSIERVNTNVVIRWTGTQGDVEVEQSRLVNGGWTTAGRSANGAFTNTIGGDREFFRLKE